MGGGSSMTTGWNYRLAWHDDICKGPVDCVRQFNGADRTAWKGKQSASGPVYINEPMLWGGDKDQGGAVGTLRWMFGEATQMPNAYLVGLLGPEQPARRGILTAVYEGGTWGANNPYQQKRSYRVERTYAGWDNDDCWYPATVRVPIEGEFTPGTPGAGTYRWAMKHNAYVAASPDGLDWSDTTAFPPGAGAEVNFGNYIVSTAPNGDTAYALYTTPGVWIPGPNVGATAQLFCRVSVINGEIWHAKGTAGYAHASNPAGPYTTGEGRTWLLAGNADYIVRYAGANQAFYTDGFWFYRSADGGATWEHVSTLELGSEGDDDYYYYLDASASSDSRLAFAGVDYGGNTKVIWSTDGFATKTESTMPAGQQGQVRELLHVGGAEWLAFVYGGMCDDGPSFLLHSTDNLASFQRIVLEIGETVAFAHQFQGNAAVDRETGQVIFVADPDGGGAHAYVSADRTTWEDIPLTFNPNTVYLIGPNDPGIPDIFGRIGKNPAHMILYAHTQEDTGNQSRDTVDLPSLKAAADWFYARGFGLCTERKPADESPDEFIQRIERVAGCSFSRSLVDGKYYFDIANGEYDLDALPIITDRDVLEFKEFPTVLQDATNSVSVRYRDPERNEDIVTPPVRALALAQQYGEIHLTLDYLEIPIGRIAVQVAERELLARITPTRLFELVCRPSVYGLRRSQYARLQLPKRGIGDMVVIVGEIQNGSLASGAIGLKLNQDVYSLPSTVYTDVELGEDTGPPTTPAEIEAKAVFEAPYIDAVASMPAADFEALPEDAGYVVAAASNPGRMRNFTMMVAPDGGEYEEVDEGEFCPSCTLTGDIEPGLRVGIGYTNARNMAAVKPGTVGVLNGELVRVDANDTNAMVLDLGRGCGDTIPHKHIAGDVILFYQVANGYDRTQHIAGEALQVKLLTNSFTKQMPLSDAEVSDVTMRERIARPYICGDIKIAGVSAYEIGNSTPGGGGSGGGGSGPTSPPAMTPGGAPASTETGPNDGFPDDGENPIPFPTVFDEDIVPGGGFDDPDDLDRWKTKNGEPLSSGWSIADGSIRFVGRALSSSVGFAHLYDAAYLHDLQFLLPHSTIPRYEFTMTVDVYCAPNTRVAVGVAYGLAGGAMQYMDVSSPATSIEFMEISHTTAGPLTVSIPLQGNATPQWAVTPVLLAIGETIYDELEARFDNVRFSVHEVPTPSTIFVPDHIDFDAGLTGWVQRSGLTGTAIDPTVVASGGALSVTINSYNFRHVTFINEDPITTADVTGKMIGVSGELWSNDPTVIRGIPYGGICLGVASKYVPTGQYTFHPLTAFLRGDWTPHEGWRRIEFHPDRTWHAASQVSHHAGQHLPVTSKVRNLQVRVTDDPVDF